MQNHLDNERQDLLSIGEAAEYLGISIDTLRRWERKGRIEPLRSPGGHRYFNKKDLDDLFGKRYSRDEETIRKSGYSQKTEIISDNNASDDVSSPLVSRETFRPVIGLPAWRAVKVEESYEETVEVIAPSESSTQEPIVLIRERILDREVREVKVPEQNVLKIAEEKNISPQEAYMRQQNTNMAGMVNTNFDRPSYSTLVPDNPPVSLPATTAIQNPAETNKAPEPQTKNTSLNLDKKTIIYISVILSIIFLSLSWYFIWQSSQRVLSPIP